MDFDQIVKLIHTVSDSNLESFAIEQGELKLSMKNRQEILMAQEAYTNEKRISKQEDNGKYIESPLVGTFYTAKSESSEPFVSVGDKVVVGQVIGIIEAMKLMNEVTSTEAGIIEEILVENEQTVEYGQKLVKVKII